MIKSVRIHRLEGQYNDDLKLVLTSPEISQGFAVQSIDGLGPGSATYNTTEWSTIDGSHDDSVHIPHREITFNLLLTDLNVYRNDTIEDVRVRSYKYFPRKKSVRLTFEMGNGKYYIDGIVTGNEPDIFQKQESQKITINCSDPYFKSETLDKYYLSELVDMFEFPFAIEETPGVPLGELIRTKSILVTNKSDVEVGAIFHIVSNGSASNITITNETNGQIMVLECTTHAGEEIIVDTRKGHKSIKASDGTDLMNYYSLGSDWIELAPGDNDLSFDADSGFNNLSVWFSVRMIYDGI